MSDLEKKVLTAGGLGSPSDGGFWLVPETFVRELQRNLVESQPDAVGRPGDAGRRQSRQAAEADLQPVRRLGCRDRRARPQRAGVWPAGGRRSSRREFLPRSPINCSRTAPSTWPPSWPGTSPRSSPGSKVLRSSTVTARRSPKAFWCLQTSPPSPAARRWMLTTLSTSSTVSRRFTPAEAPGCCGARRSAASAS